ncbi:hypothetical protein I4U23_025632 [Adineta vaga]|nr:hypothetical protein I4U23_025632 [Adineta vaga]
MIRILSSFSIAILFMIVISFMNAEKICPGYGFVPRPENCTSTCSADNDQCIKGLKCCYRPTEPCGYHCIEPKTNITKQGKCPTVKVDDPMWYLCDAHLCDVDSDCRGKQKCCSNMCGAKICTGPLLNK